MRLLRFIILLVFTLVFSFYTSSQLKAAVTPTEAAKSLPDKAGDWRAQNAARNIDLSRDLSLTDDGAAAVTLDPEVFFITSAATRSYVSADKTATIKIVLVRTRTDAGAYALLSALRSSSDGSNSDNTTDALGTASIANSAGIAFFKGSNLVLVKRADVEGTMTEGSALASAARAVAATLDGGDGEIPVLVKHLPDWEKVEARALYAVTRPALQQALGAYGDVFADVDFSAGTEAVVAPYDASSRVVIVEQTTPQMAFSNNALVDAQVLRLREAGKPTPTSYKRVGNYLVFVFGEANEQAATDLIGRVNYEQVVRWLGDNPRAYDLAERRYAETTANMILTTLKATGLSLIACLGIGAVFGGFVFMRRRSQQVVTKVYSDAGGMIRLNIDDITGQQSGAAKLLGSGDDAG